MGNELNATYGTLLIGWFYITVSSTLISKQKRNIGGSFREKNKTSATISSYSVRTSHGGQAPPLLSPALPYIWLMGCESTVSSLITNLKGLIVPLLPFSYFYSGRSSSFLEAAFPSVSKTPILGTSPEVRKQPPYTETFSSGGPRFSSRGRWARRPGVPALRKRHFKG